jgi:hypothetical protein
MCYYFRGLTETVVERELEDLGSSLNYISILNRVVQR